MKPSCNDMKKILRHCPPDCLDEGTCHPGQPLPYNKNICYRPPKEGIVKTDDPSTCPRCGSTETDWCGGDSDGHGNYYHMYLCDGCGHLTKGVQVFLVPCSKEEYGHDPCALPRDPNESLSMAYLPIDVEVDDEEPIDLKVDEDEP